MVLMLGSHRIRIGQFTLRTRSICGNFTNRRQQDTGGFRDRRCPRGKGFYGGEMRNGSFFEKQSSGF